MTGMQIDFSWLVAETYEIRRMSGHGVKQHQIPYEIVASGPTTMRRPLDRFPLALILLDTYRRLEGHPDQLQKTVHNFASQFGLLFEESLGPRGEEGEPLDLWQGLIYELQSMLQSFDDAAWLIEPWDMGWVDAVLTSDPLSRKPALMFRPHRLLNAIKLQLAHKIARGAVIKQCHHCRQYFEAGIDGRRPDARFCSDACRYAAASRRRAG